MIAAIVYPHQLFPNLDWLQGAQRVYVVEDPLLFTQYAFHRQKRMLHRASLRAYADRLRAHGSDVHYIEAKQLETSGTLAAKLASDGATHCRVIDPEDHDLSESVIRGCNCAGLELQVLDDPHFLTSTQQIDAFVADRDKLLFTSFYIEQRKRLQVLIDDRQKAVGGKWSFDTENRRRLPSDVVPPNYPFPVRNAYADEAAKYVECEFPDSLGDVEPLFYPHDAKGAELQLERFVSERLNQFGDYEDAISREHTFLNHSVLTPVLNLGLISPRCILDRVLRDSDTVPMNSLEGFIRQVIGWREYMRLVYRKLGSFQRTKNYWQHHRSLPKAFYNGTTQIEPVDHVIRRVLRYGYCHHIERLMILGNFMLLCEFHPDTIFQWFMELFVDAYDWVMVPNVYGMSQHADGGTITTKPYISGSSYVLKMSDFKKGDWCGVWDGLYWNFIAKHRSFFEANPRMKVMTSQLDRMGEKLTEHRRVAEQFLGSWA